MILAIQLNYSDMRKQSTPLHPSWAWRLLYGVSMYVALECLFMPVGALPKTSKTLLCEGIQQALSKSFTQLSCAIHFIGIPQRLVSPVTFSKFFHFYVMLDRRVIFRDRNCVSRSHNEVGIWGILGPISFVAEQTLSVIAAGHSINCALVLGLKLSPSPINLSY